MNTLELTRDLSENKKTRSQFKGVFPADCLPQKKLRKPAFVVANIDISSQPGTHWVGFYFPKIGQGEFFCSFGSPPISGEFIKFLTRNCTSYVYNKQRLQSDFSSYCGQYCCMYLHYRCVGKTLKQFIKMFSSSKFDFNDNKVIHLYHGVYAKTNQKSKKLQVGGRGRGRGKVNNLLPYVQNCKSRYCQ